MSGINSIYCDNLLSAPPPLQFFFEFDKRRRPHDGGGGGGPMCKEGIGLHYRIVTCQSQIKFDVHWIRVPPLGVPLTQGWEADGLFERGAPCDHAQLDGSKIKIERGEGVMKYRH